MKVKVKSPVVYPVIVPTTLGNLQTINFYLVEAEGKLILIDAGVDNDACWDNFCEVLRENDFTLHDLDAIILTHNHSDHIGLVNRIRQICDIPVYAHEDAIIRLKRDRNFLEKRAQFFEKLYGEMGCGSDADELLERLKTSIDRNAHQKINGEIQSLVGGDYICGFNVIEVPGHAPDQITLWHEESGMMFVGDHLIKHSPSNALVELGKDGKRIRSLILYEKSLKKLLDFKVKTAYSGHGELIGEPYKLIHQKLERIKQKGNRIEKLLTEEKTAAEIAKELYGNRYEPLLPLVMSEIIGHLDRLESLGKIVKEIRRNVYYFKQNKVE